MGRGAVLVEFWDFARVNSLRTMPYLKAWHERYADAGLRVIGIHSPGYSFGRDRDTVARAVERLEVALPGAARPRAGGLARCTATWAGRAATCSTAPASWRSSTTARASTWRRSWRFRNASARRRAARPGTTRGRPRGAAGAADRGHRPAGRPRAARAGARLGRRRRLDRGGRRRGGGELRLQRRRRVRRALRRRTSSRGSTSRTGRSRPSPPACACTACSSRPRRQLLADLLREHEADVLLDDLELRRRPWSRARGRSRPAAEPTPRARWRPS